MGPGRLALAQHDLVDRAYAARQRSRKSLGKPDRGAVIADLGAVAEAAGTIRKRRARATSSCCRGDYGARAARQATVRLAILDGVGGDVTAGLKRLERLTPEASDPARRALVMQSARSALARGAVGDAIATLARGARRSDRARARRPIADGASVSRHRARSARRSVCSPRRRRAPAPTPPDALFAAARRPRARAARRQRHRARDRRRMDSRPRPERRGAGAAGPAPRRSAATASAPRGAVAAAVHGGPRAHARVARSTSPRSSASASRRPRWRWRAKRSSRVRHRSCRRTRTAAGLAMVGALAEQAGDDDTALAAFTTLTARYGKEPVAADAAYRAARLAAKRLPGGDAGGVRRGRAQQGCARPSRRRRRARLRGDREAVREAATPALTDEP